MTPSDRVEKAGDSPGIGRLMYLEILPALVRITQSETAGAQEPDDEDQNNEETSIYDSSPPTALTRSNPAFAC